MKSEKLSELNLKEASLTELQKEARRLELPNFGLLDRKRLIREILRHQEQRSANTERSL